MIDRIPGLPNNVVGFTASGDVTRADYEDRLDPAIEKALETPRPDPVPVRARARIHRLHGRRHMGGRQARSEASHPLGARRRGSRSIVD